MHPAEFHPSMKESRIVAGALGRREGHMLVKNLSSVKDIATHIIGMAVHDPPAFGQATAFVAKIQMWEAQNGGDVVVQAIQKTFLLSFTCAPGVANEHKPPCNSIDKFFKQHNYSLSLSEWFQHYTKPPVCWGFHLNPPQIRQVYPET